MSETMSDLLWMLQEVVVMLRKGTLYLTTVAFSFGARARVLCAFFSA
jgi:hypothetical protein